MLEFKAAALDSFTISDEGEVTGYGSVFGERDQDGDTVIKGAFKRTLRERKGSVIPMLREHYPADVVGAWTSFEEDDRGLRLKGQLAMDVQAGREARSLIKMKCLGGLSIGYRTVKAMADGAGRILQDLDLFEVSLVTFPMLRSARIEGVKTLFGSGRSPTVREFEGHLRDAGFSKSAAASMASACKAHLRGEPEAKADEALEFLRLLRA